MDREFWENQRIVNERKQQRQQVYSGASHRRLAQSIKKKIMTTMIGALDRFEKQFGDIWENNAEAMQEWQELRKAVLDNGNRQIRMMNNELDDYDVKWNKYSEFRRRNYE